jgi:hypothetical protein
MDGFKVSPVPRDQATAMLQRARSDQRVAQLQPRFSTDASGALCDRSVHRYLAERTEQLSRPVRAVEAREQFGPRDYRVMQAMPAWSKLVRTPQMVDKNISVDQKVSHCCAANPGGWKH